MHLLNPWGLTLLAYAIPAIIFLYLLKRKYRSQIVSSNLLWRNLLEDYEANQPWKKFSHQWLLWLQLLAAILLIFIFSRPSIPVEAIRTSSAIIVIDISGSMQTKETEKTRLVLAKEKAMQLVEAKSSEQKITLVAAGKTPRLLISQSEHQGEIEKAIETIKPEMGSSDLHAALSYAHALAADQQSEIIFIGDGANGPASLTSLPHRFINVGKTQNNVTIGATSIASTNGEQELFVRLDQQGTVSNTFPVHIRDAQGKLLATRSVTLVKNDSQEIHFEKLPKSVYYQVQIRPSKEGLALDNQRYQMSVSDQRFPVYLQGSSSLFLQKVFAINKRLEPIQSKGMASEQQQQKGLTVVTGKQDLPKQGPYILFANDWKSLPLQKGKITSSIGPVQLNQSHPITQGIRLKSLSVADLRKVTKPEWAQVLIQSGDTPLLLAGEKNGQRVVIFPFDLTKSDLALQPYFPVLMMRITQWLLPEMQAEKQEESPGKQVQIPLPPGMSEVKWNGVNELKVLGQKQGKMHVQLPEKTGLIKFYPKDGNKAFHYVNIPFPEDESKIKPDKIPTTPLAIDSTSASGEQEIWWWLALATLGVVVWEWMVFARGY